MSEVLTFAMLRNEPPKNWCPACGRRPNHQVALILCKHSFHDEFRTAAAMYEIHGPELMKMLEEMDHG